MNPFERKKEFIKKATIYRLKEIYETEEVMDRYKLDNYFGDIGSDSKYLDLPGLSWCKLATFLSVPGCFSPVSLIPSFSSTWPSVFTWDY
jgi:hypothetical protein